MNLNLSVKILFCELRKRLAKIKFPKEKKKLLRILFPEYAR